MPIIHDFKKHTFTGGSLTFDAADQLPIINMKRYGNGLADIIPAIANFIGNNKELISNVSNVAKAAGSVTDASSKITQAVKAAKQLSQLKEIQTVKKEHEQGKRKKKDQAEVSKILNEHNSKKHKTTPYDPQGDGFCEFP